MDQNMPQVLNHHRLQALSKWLEETDITLTQINGQRKYGGPPPGWTGPAPGPGCEVFISQIPRDMYEDQLIPLFQRVAPLYEFRLMMNFSGQNRGFAYAKYGDMANAAATIQALNLYPLQNGVRLAVRKSTEKRQLCLCSLPPRIEGNELLTVLRDIADGVESVTMRTTGPRERDVMALVHYSSHYAASMAKKVLVQAFKKLYGVSIFVQWMSGSTRFRSKDDDKESSLSVLGMKSIAVNSPRFQVSRDTEHAPPSPLPLQIISEAAGGPAPHLQSVMLPVNPGLAEEPLHDPVRRLRRLCELHGFGVPLYNMRYNHTGPDGFLYFAFRVMVPGMAVPFCGVVHVLPSTCAKNLEAEVRQAAAKQLLDALWQAINP